MVEMTEAEQRELVEALNETLDIDIYAETDDHQLGWVDTHMLVTINDVVLPDTETTHAIVTMALNQAVERAILDTISDMPMFESQSPVVSAELWNPPTESYR